MIFILLKSKDFRTRDIFIDYPFEKAKFRWEQESSTVFRRFYGEAEEAFDREKSGMWHEATRTGTEITREDYFAD